jgi:hypothetical protein
VDFDRSTLWWLVAFNLLFAGLLAGVETAVHYGLRAPLAALEERPQIELRKRLVRRLRVLVPALFAPMALSGVALAVVDAAAPGRLLRCAARVLIRAVGAVRINKATLGWDASAPPADWRTQLSRVERFHVAGAWAADLAFVFFLMAALSPSS